MSSEQIEQEQRRFEGRLRSRADSYRHPEGKRCKFWMEYTDKYGQLQIGRFGSYDTALTQQIENTSYRPNDEVVVYGTPRTVTPPSGRQKPEVVIEISSIERVRRSL